MMWFVKIRTPRWLITAVAVVTVLGMTLAGVLFPVPDLGLGLQLPVTLGMFIPSLAACAVMASVTYGSEEEVRAKRPARLLDAAWVLACTAIVTLPYLLEAWQGDGAATGSARNCVGFIGVGLIGRRLLRGLSVTALPALFAMTTAVISSTTTSPLIAWAYLPASSGPAAAAAAGIWVLGVALGRGRRNVMAERP